MNIGDMRVAVIGLGDVGLPLAIEFGRVGSTIGFDVSESKIQSLRRHIDTTGEVSNDRFDAADKLIVTSEPSMLGQADFIVVAVPTPVDEAHRPDFRPLISASETAGKYMKRGAIVVYESTVYPRATEDRCIPVLEKLSGLKWREDFHVGYSPERINPGDKEHIAGVYRASSIKVAEAAKVIENAQRDLNIALRNELSLIFDRIGIDTTEELAAAGTRWNFLRFSPGLVGGHCTGVDPYYLTYKTEMLRYHPQVILSGRRINDGMGKFVAEHLYGV